jgi:GNAT superfamily N-acetyltransferase
VTDETPDKFTIEPFDPDRHDRTAFSCGVEQVDNFFKKTANKLSKADNTRIYVMTSAGGAVIGFYALNAHAVDYQDLPQNFARTRRSHGSIPAAFLSMIGVDQRYARQGYGGDLLIDALIRIATAAESIGISVVILDVLNDGNVDLVARRKALYAKYGFQPLPSNPLRMFLPVATVRKLLDQQ